MKILRTHSKTNLVLYILPRKNLYVPSLCPHLVLVTGRIRSARVFNRLIETETGPSKAIALFENNSRNRSTMIEKLNENFALAPGKFYTALTKELQT